MKQITIGIVAHVDAGKTTFAEQLLFHTKSIRHRGRVDHQDAFMDNHHIEKARGITVFSEQAHFVYNDTMYHLIDTPGHVDFSSEMERSIQIMDYAIVIISAVEGVEGHTETVWQLLRQYNVPTFFFINKTDRVGAELNRVIGEIQTELSSNVFYIDHSLKKGILNQNVIEWLAEKNDILLEKFLNDDYNSGIWLLSMKEMIKSNAIFPILSGSALQDIGISTFIETIDELTFAHFDSNCSFSGKVYKIRHDEKGTKLAYIKVLSGRLNVRDVIQYAVGENQVSEKVTQMRRYNGKKYEIIDQISAGELVAVTGLSAVSVGSRLGCLEEENIGNTMVPTLKSKVIFDASYHIKDVLSCLQLLDMEDPSLKLTWDESLQEIHIHVMGSIQLEILQQIIMDRFQLAVTFDKPNILYKETINTTVIGYGHFEPLKHYAEVHIKLEPSQRSRGISFQSVCHTDDLIVGYQNLVKHYLLEKEHRGILTGSPLTDMKITLLTGRAHNKHTSGGDFKEATLRALRQGLEKAETILLEPFYEFKIKVDLDDMGRVLSDIQASYGIFNPPEINSNKAIITGSVPVATFIGYSTVFASFTHGKGSLSLQFGGYHRCHNEKEVIEQIAYNKNADKEYSSSSIFCSKGQGFIVPWDEAEEKMHCL